MEEPRLIPQGRIEVIGQFDGGGLGLLLRCRDEKGLVFATKFPKDFDRVNQSLVDDEERRLIRYQGRFVVQYFGKVVLPDGRRGFAMEAMSGSLSSLIRMRGALAPEEFLHYFESAAKGLAEVHASAPGAHHGDVKPANLLHKNGWAKLCDFGLALGGIGQTVMFAPHTGGTPGYMPPEGVTSPQGDMYSLGVTALALLSGREPNAKVMASVSLAQHPKLIGLLNQMLNQDSWLRPSMNQVLEQLPAIKAEASAVATNTIVKQVTMAVAIAGVAFLVVKAFSE